MANPDLQIKGGGVGLQKTFFGPSGPSPGSATVSEVNNDACKFQPEEDLFTTRCLVKTILIEGLFRFVSKLDRKPLK